MKKQQNPAILVTGGAGYIGAHCCKTLFQAGFLPVTYDNLSEGHEYAVKWGPLVKGDVRDRKTLDSVFFQYRPLAVLHFAGSALIDESLRDPGKYYANNVAGTLTLLEAMRDFGITSIIFSSSCTTYGNPLSTPIKEDHPQNPLSPYGHSKLMVEKILKDFENYHQIKSVILRYFNAAGADLDGEVGENHAQETHLIPLVIQTALNLRPHLNVYGTDYATKDGSAVRDYIHVNDLADAHLKALKFLLENQKCLCLNLGTGNGYSVLEIIRAVESHCGKKIPLKFAERRQGDPHSLFADSSLAKKILNWSPSYSDLPTIIGSAWKWHQHLAENPNDYISSNETIFANENRIK